MVGMVRGKHDAVARADQIAQRLGAEGFDPSDLQLMLQLAIVVAFRQRHHQRMMPGLMKFVFQFVGKRQTVHDLRDEK